MKQKKCSRCGHEKPLSEFGKYSKSKDGKHYRCTQCNREVNYASYRKHREKRKTENKARYWRERDKKLAYQRKWQKENPDRYKCRQLQTKFGITLKEYEAMLEKQGGGCAICGRKQPGNGKTRHFAVDHCHDTGAVRGLLCQFCNRGLGFLGDTKEALQKAIEYLVESEGARLNVDRR